MIASASEKPLCRRGWQRHFAKLLPKVRTLAKRTFRRLRFQEREEAVADVLAKVCTAYRQQVELDKESIAYATHQCSTRSHGSGSSLCRRTAHHQALSTLSLAARLMNHFAGEA
ncbi:MAG: hypothetical protein JNM18_23640 [Planctomycetaceae bacterium]|nr:hypothetical protein [Planctomycetaceae bacterium]